GAGAGAFTLARADLSGPHGLIHAIDRDRGALAELRASAVSSIPRAEIRTQVGDFTQRLELDDLDGVVMANSLHFVEEKLPVLARVRRYLKSEGVSSSLSTTATRATPGCPIRCRSVPGSASPKTPASARRCGSRAFQVGFS